MNPLAMIDMKSKLKGNVTNKVTDSKINSFTSSNLNKIEDILIKEIIQGDKKAVEVKTKITVMTLDEAVDKIKNNR